MLEQVLKTNKARLHLSDSFLQVVRTKATAMATT